MVIAYQKYFFTGDPAQTINPSGFSWNKIKKIIFINPIKIIIKSIKLINKLSLNT